MLVHLRLFDSNDWTRVKERNDSLALIWGSGFLRKSETFVKAVACNAPHPGRRKENERCACISELSLSELCSSVGLAGLLLATVEHLDLCEQLRLKPIVRWTDCAGACGSSVAGKNYWLRYFSPVSDMPHDWADRTPGFLSGALCLGEPLSVTSSLHAGSEVSLSQWQTAHAQSNTGFRLRVSGEPELQRRHHVQRVLSKYVSIRPELQLQADHFGQLENVLGIHIRGTDRSFIVGPSRSPPLSVWIETTKQLLSYLATSVRLSEQIVVAADSNEAIEAFHRHFGDDRILAQHDTDNVQCARLHDDFHWLSAVQETGEHLGNGVLIDIQLLSRCRWLLTGPSSSAVVTIATYFNPDLIIYSVPGWSDSRLSSIKVQPQDEDFDSMQYTDECFQRNRALSACHTLTNASKYALLARRPFINVAKACM